MQSKVIVESSTNLTPAKKVNDQLKKLEGWKVVTASTIAVVSAVWSGDDIVHPKGMPSQVLFVTTVVLEK